MQSESGDKKKESAVYSIVRASRCHNCDAKLEPGTIVKLNRQDDEKEVRCLQCAGLDALVFLRSGNTKLTGYVKKHSAQFFVVIRWSELWKTYERIGVLAQGETIDQGKKELK
ncbi:MAG TPA: hypothetical protein V6C81_04365 [Planktothrix sp.]|jgi:hypothetical protein